MASSSKQTVSLRLIPVYTPSTLDLPNKEAKTIHEIGSLLTCQMNTYGKWTDECTSLMKSNSRMLLRFDRFEYLGNGYDNHKFKMALNPLMILCPHPSCLQKNEVIRISHPFNLKKYLVHLESHYDRMGEAMKLRFGAVYNNMFVSTASLDKLSISPHNLQTVKKG